MTADKVADIVVAVRCHGERQGWIHPSLYLWSLRLNQEPKYRIAIHTIFDLPNAAASANTAVKVFFEEYPDVPWLCIVDNDVAPPANMLRILDGFTGLIIGGISHQFQNDRLTVQQGWGYGSPLDGTFNPVDPTRFDGPIPVDRLGGGCWFIHRSVFAEMKKPYFVEIFDPEDHMLMVSDDIYFQNKARDLGIKLYCDPRFITAHFHTRNLGECSA